MKILAIETSCDDTGIAILEVKGDKKSPIFNVLSNIVSSQIEVHKKYGGVYPALAKREHQENLVPALKLALRKARMLEIFNFQFSIFNQFSMTKFSKVKTILEREPELEKKLAPFLQKYEKPDIDLIAVTNGPGLEPCLWVGVNFARALSYFWDIPIVPVNHIEGHILVNFFQNKNIEFPSIALVVSGGHTQIILMEKIGKYKILGETRDDAAGECFDKCAKILGLNYPGGPAVAAMAKKFEIRKNPTGNPPAGVKSKFEIRLPRPMINTKEYDFSFSGLKTAVLYAWQKIELTLNSNDRSERELAQKQMSAEIQQAVIDVLLKKTLKAAKNYNAKSLILGGGVSANKELRRQFKQTFNNSTAVELFIPPPDLSTDNALMTAVAGYFRCKNSKTGNWKNLKAKANLRI